MRIARRLLAVTVLAVAVVAAGGAAPARAADDAAAADKHIKAGVDLRRRGDDQAALGEFTKAYELGRTPRASAQVALCEQSLARWVDAHAHMLEALASKDDPWIKKNWGTLQTALAAIRQHTARLEVVGSPDGAALSVAGRDIGRLPMASPALVNAGTIDLEVTAPGHKAVQRSFTLEPEGYQRVLVRLEREGVGAGAGAVAAVTRVPEPAASSGAPAGSLVAAPSSSSSAEDGGESSPLYARPWFWVAIGALVAVGVAGAVFATRGTEYPAGQSRTLPQ